MTKGKVIVKPYNDPKQQEEKSEEKTELKANEE